MTKDSDKFSIKNLELYGKLIDFHDGHVPETFSPEIHGKLLVYTKEAISHTEPTIQTYQNVLPDSICLELYNFTKDRTEPWGTYVTKEEILGTNSQNRCSFIDCLALEAAKYFLDQDNSKAHVLHGGNEPARPLDDDRVHGVQIWALASDVGSSVPVHIDYAEYLRYCHNVIVPPLYAGTVHCTPTLIVGGSFAVNARGLDYYREVGYKGIFVSNRLGNWHPETNTSMQDCRPQYNVHNGWYTIPYKYNQGILHTGNLAHLSSPIDQIEGVGSKRVIIGFNLFAKDVGAFVQKVPEHSDQFRRLVRINRSLVIRNGGLRLEEINSNKPLIKMLTLAKRKQAELVKVEQEKYIYEWLALSFRSTKAFTMSDIISKWKTEVKSTIDLVLDIEIMITLLVRSKRSLWLEGKEYLLEPISKMSCFDEHGILNMNSPLNLILI